MALFNYFNHIAKVPSIEKIETEIEFFEEHIMAYIPLNHLSYWHRYSIYDNGHSEAGRGREYWSFLRDIEVFCSLPVVFVDEVPSDDGI